MKHLKHRKKQKKLTLPRFRRSLFWDVDPKDIDPKKHATYIIERILDFGTDKEVKWMWKTYTKSRIHDIVKKSRGIHPQSRALWKNLTQ